MMIKKLNSRSFLAILMLHMIIFPVAARAEIYLNAFGLPYTVNESSKDKAQLKSEIWNEGDDSIHPDTKEEIFENGSKVKELYFYEVSDYCSTIEITRTHHKSDCYAEGGELKAEISYDEEEELINSRVFEALGGYAPTFGIVGAVFGLIQIMGYIEQPDILAQGIAVAFVSTLYGVGFANLLFLPVAGKLKMNLREKVLLKEVVLQGIVSIQMEESPMVIEEKLLAYLKYHNRNHMINEASDKNFQKKRLYGSRQ